MGLLAALDDHPLRVSRDFRTLFIGNALVALSGRWFSITLAWWLVTLDGGGGSPVGIFMAVYGGAVFLASAAVGPLVDRMDRRRAMVASALIQGSFVSIIGVCLWHARLGMPLLCVLGAGVGAAVPLFESAVVSSLAHTVEDRHVEAATAVQASAVELANIFAAALSSSVIAFAGIVAAVAVNAALYLAGALFVARIKVALSPAAEPGPRGRYWTEWCEGLRALTDDRVLLRLFALVAIYGLLVLPAFLLVPVLVNEVLHLPVSWVAIFEISLSVGAVATTGALSMGRRDLGNRWIIPTLLAASGASLAMAGWVRSPLALAAVFAVLGSSYAGFFTLSYVAFQRRVPDERKGRLFALLATVSTGLSPVAFLLAGMAADAYSPGAVLMAAGAGMAVLTAVSLLDCRGETPAAG